MKKIFIIISVLGFLLFTGCGGSSSPADHRSDNSGGSPKKETGNRTENYSLIEGVYEAIEGSGLYLVIDEDGYVNTYGLKDTCFQKNPVVQGITVNAAINGKKLVHDKENRRFVLETEFDTYTWNYNDKGVIDTFTINGTTYNSENIQISDLHSILLVGLRRDPNLTPDEIASYACGTLESIYKSNGTYDLRDYLFPSQNSIVTTESKTYKNPNGERVFTDAMLDASQSETEIKKYEVNGSVVTEYSFYEGQYEEDEKYKTESDRILAFTKDNYSNRDYRLDYATTRKADTGDQIMKYVYYDRDEDIPLIEKAYCRLDSHLSRKEVAGVSYPDVLKIVCHFEGKGSYTDDSNVTGTLSVDGDAILFAAKERGVVAGDYIDCRETTIHSASETNTTKSCKKRVKRVVSFEVQ